LGALCPLYSGDNMNPLLLSLDPATHITGYAIHEKQAGSVWDLKQYGRISAKHISKKNSEGELADLNFRCLDINSRLRNLIVTLQPTQLIMEFPEYQPNRRLAEGKQVKSIKMLSFLCGKISLGWELYISEVNRASKQMLPLAALITPRQWKGQTTKDITAHRLEKHYGFTEDEDNCVDAIMIGRWWINRSEHKVNKGTAPRVDL